MLSRDKRASLSPKLLSSRDAGAQAVDEGAGLRARAERLAARHRTPASQVSDGPGAEARPDDSRDEVLAAKGGASASGFRPSQWSYERESAPSHDETSTVTPFPTAASVAASPAGGLRTMAASQSPGKTTIAVAAFGVLALVTSASLVIFGRSHEPSPAMPPASQASAQTKTEDAAPGQETAAPAEPAPPVEAAKAAPEQHETPEPVEQSGRLPQKVEPAQVLAPSDALSPQELAGFVVRGDQLFATGDIVAARVFYTRAAEHGDVAAATAVGKTFDPIVLEEMHARGIRPDPVMAARWYLRASAAGDEQGSLLMKRLMARYAG